MLKISTNFNWGLTKKSVVSPIPLLPEATLYTQVYIIFFIFA